MDEVMDCRSVSVKDAVGHRWLAIGLSGLELSVVLEGHIISYHGHDMTDMVSQLTMSAQVCVSVGIVYLRQLRHTSPVV